MDAMYDLTLVKAETERINRRLGCTIHTLFTTSQNVSLDRIGGARAVRGMKVLRRKRTDTAKGERGDDRCKAVLYAINTAKVYGPSGSLDRAPMPGLLSATNTVRASLCERAA